jgi:hypothetical protein
LKAPFALSTTERIVGTAALVQSSTTKGRANKSKQPARTTASGERRRREADLRAATMDASVQEEWSRNRHERPQRPAERMI